MHDLRTFLRRLERSGDLLRIEAGLDSVLETTSLCRRSLQEEGPALLLSNIRDASHAMPGNLFGHQRRIEAALKDRPIASLRELGELLASLREPRLPGSWQEALTQWPELGQLAHVTPKRVDEAAFNQVILKGDEIDLARLPIQTC